jgi:hypothetical protein
MEYYIPPFSESRIRNIYTENGRSKLLRNVRNSFTDYAIIEPIIPQSVIASTVRIANQIIYCVVSFGPYLMH